MLETAVSDDLEALNFKFFFPRRQPWWRLVNYMFSNQHDQQSFPSYATGDSDSDSSASNRDGNYKRRKRRKQSPKQKAIKPTSPMAPQDKEESRKVISLNRGPEGDNYVRFDTETTKSEELVLTKHMVNYLGTLGKLWLALEEVGLRKSDTQLDLFACLKLVEHAITLLGQANVTICCIPEDWEFYPPYNRNEKG